MYHLLLIQMISASGRGLSPPLTKGEKAMTVSEVKSNLLDTLNAMDKSRMNVYDLKVYADTLRTVADTSDKTYAETMSEVMARMSSRCACVPKED